MASAPRPGRKGGKIESPAIAPAVPSQSPPSDIKIAREASEQLDAPQSNVSSTFLQFDPTAIDVVGKGVVLGGSKGIRTEQRTTNADKSAVQEKLEAFMISQPVESQTRDTKDADNCSSVDELLTSNAIVATTYHEGLNLTVRVAIKEKSSSILVVVPSYFVVEKTVDALQKASGNSGIVGEWVGNTIAGSSSKTRIWVADAKTALAYLTKCEADKSSDFNLTHVAFFKIRSHQPVSQLVLEAIRLMPSFAAKVIVAGGSIAEALDKFKEYVAPRTVAASAAVAAAPPHRIETITLEEACALTDADVVTVAVDRTGKFPGPHPKVVEHSLEVCIALLRKAFSLAKAPQVAVVFTADVGDTIAHLQKSSLAAYVVQRDELVSASEGGAQQEQSGHKVHVFHHCDLDEGLGLDVTIVVDKGTMKMSWVPSATEGAYPCKRTEWQSKHEQSLRKRILGWNQPGLYIALYPTEAEEVFPAATALHLELIDMETAMLHCSRCKAFVTPEKLLTQFPKESILRAMLELSESGAIVAPDNLGFTFTGEVLSRLPTLTDVSNLCLYGLIVGLEEPAIAVAALATIHLYAHKTNSNQSNPDWFDEVNSVRRKYAGEKAKSSDVLADTLIALKWLQTSLADASAGDALAAAIDVPVYRLKSITALMAHMREQLTDYAFLDSFTNAAAVERIARSLETNWDVLVLILSVVFCRKAVIVRTDGSLNARDTSGNMMFLRTSKTAAPNTYFPSLVHWQTGNAVVGITVQNSGAHLYMKDVTTLKTSYLLAALVLLAPSVEYSAPQVSDQGTFIYFSLAANAQQKRFKVGIETAARILEFREKWNRTYGGLTALRSMPRRTTLAQFTQAIQQKDKSFQLKSMQRELQEELTAVVLGEIVVFEDSRSFPNTSVHRFAPLMDVVDTTCVAPSSDDEVAVLFRNRSVDRQGGALQATTTIPRTAASTAAPTPQPVPAQQAAAFVEDDVETEQSYFARHGPLIEDDDE